MKGLTLIEIIIAIAVLLIVGTLSAGAFSSFKKAGDLSSAADVAMAYLVQARSKTLSAENAARYGVHFESDKIVFFEGAVYVINDPNNQQTVLSETVEISSISLTGGGSDVLFKKLIGETDNDGAITVRMKSDVSKTKIINIRKTGLASVQ